MPRGASGASLAVSQDVAPNGGPAWPQEQLLQQLRLWLCTEGAAQPQEHNSSRTGPRAKGTGRWCPRSGDSPWERWRSGRPRIVRTLLPPVTPSSADQCPQPPEHPDTCGMGAVVVTVGADSRAGELDTITVVVPPVVTLYLGLNRGLT